MEQNTYDVFISYSRRDYVQNDEIIPGNPISAIIDLFDKNGVSYWIDKEGIFSGEEFVKEISKAIVNSKMLVFVSSKSSNESEYTCGELLKAKKAKKLIIPFLIDKCDFNDKFEILLLPLQHIDYIEQPDKALAKLLRAVNREKKRIENVEVDAKKQQIIETTRNEIKEKTKEYHALEGQQDAILMDLYVKNKILGNTIKQCPVCGNEVLIRSAFCDKCGWQFPSLYSLDGKRTPVCDETQLTIARKHWDSLSNVVVLRNEIKHKEEEVEEEKSKNAELRKQFEALERRQVEILEELREKEGKKEEEEKRHQKGTNLEDLIFDLETTSFKMIHVNGGRFLMGDSDCKMALDDMKQSRWVELEDYYIGETVVTQALWKAVMGEKNNPSNWKGDELPVETVSWNDAKEFIVKLNEKISMQLPKESKFRLPSESEWEYAARGGSKSDNKYKYSGSDNIDEVAWYEDNSWYKTHIVKRKKANELGLYDMSGNVWEWCEDKYGSRRVLRGGSWGSSPRDCCVSFRSSGDPLNRNRIIGFRLALASFVNTLT